MTRSRPTAGFAGVLGFAMLLTVACAPEIQDQPTATPSITDPTTSTEQAPGDAVTFRSVNVINTYPHDESMYTQGLEFVDGLLLESGGLRQQSSIRLYDPTDGSVVTDQDVTAGLFAEGATVFGDEVWQLTWTSEKALVYDLDGLRLKDEVSYQGEGWGLCSLDDQFVMSNGSDRLTFRQTSDFSPTGSVSVRLDGVGPVKDLNELECVQDGNSADTGAKIWANSYQSTFIFGIDPETGEVTDVVDAESLVPPGFEGNTDLVLNGIAVHPDTGRFWVTGKQWPVLYEVEFVE